MKINRFHPWYFFADTANKYSESHTAIWSRERIYTYAEAHGHAVQLANWLLSQGIRPGDLVALYMTNCPEIMFTWLALLCIGCAPAFINFNLEGKGLLHCLNVCKAPIILVDEDAACQTRIARSKDDINGNGMRIVIFDDIMKQEIAKMPVTVPGDEYRQDIKPDFPFCLSYTRYV